MKTNRVTHSGNRIQVEFDGVAIGLLQNLRPSEDYGHQPASGIGDILVTEYVPSMANYRLTASTMVLFTDNMRSAGIAMEDEKDVLKGMVFDIVIFGGSSGAVPTASDNGITTQPVIPGEGILRKYMDCTYTGGDIDISKHAIVAANANFVALRVSGKQL